MKIWLYVKTKIHFGGKVFVVVCGARANTSSLSRHMCLLKLADWVSLFLVKKPPTWTDVVTSIQIRPVGSSFLCKFNVDSWGHMFHQQIYQMIKECSSKLVEGHLLMFSGLVVWMFKHTKTSHHNNKVTIWYQINWESLILQQQVLFIRTKYVIKKCDQSLFRQLT